MTLLTSLSWTGERVAMATSGHLGVEQRDGPVLQLARRVALGVDVADLLELQRALQRHRVAAAAADEHEAAGVDVAPGDRCHLAGAVERALRLVRQRPQGGHQAGLLVARETPAELGDGGRQEDQRGDLGHERLRGHDRDLWPGLQEQDRVALPGDGRAHGIGDRDDGAALLACEARRARWCRPSRPTA